MKTCICLFIALSCMFPLSHAESYELRHFTDVFSHETDSVPLITGEEIFTAQLDSQNVRRVGRSLFEPLDVVCAKDGKCYTTSTRDVIILDVSDPARPREEAVVSLPTARKATDIFVAQPYVYVAKADEGFWIIEHIGGEEYEVVGSYDTGEWISTVEVRNDTAFIISGYDIQILDVSDPGEVEFYGSITYSSGPNDFFLTDTLCYVTCSRLGLRVIDVSNPTGPEEIGSFEPGESFRTQGVYVRDDLGYVNVSDELWVVDVKDPLAMEFVDSINLDPTHGDDLEMFSHYVVVKNYWVNGRFHIIDVSDPHNMEEVYQYVVNDLYDIHLDEPYLYLVDNEGMKVMDVSVPESTVEVGSYDGNHSVQSVCTVGDKCYVSDYGDGLRIIDISDRRKPKIEGFYAIQSAYDVEVEFPYAYVASILDGFTILDISNPDSISEVGFIDIDGRGVFVDYPYAYLAIYRSAGHDGLEILDISNPDSIADLSYFDIQITDEVFVKDERAYVAASFDGVYIIDVNDPYNPEQISIVNGYDLTTDIHVSGNYLYIADGSAGVRVIDVSDPENWEEVGRSLAGYGNQIHVVEPYLYLAGGSSGLKVLDISVPDSIREVGYYGVASLGGIWADEDYIYMGTYDNGLFIFEFYPTGIEADNDDSPQLIPRTFALHQNYPNPFNPTTTISFEIPGTAGERQPVVLTVYDLRGRLVKKLVDGKLEPGTHHVTWDGKSKEGNQVSSGIYLYTLKTGEGVRTRKMTIIK